MKTKKTHYTSYLILALFGLYMLFPFVSTFFYATSTKWSNTMLPNDFTFKWFIQLIEDPNFISAVVRSFTLTFTTLAVVLVVMVPTVFLVYTYFPKVDQFMKGLVLMPYAIPGVILATGLLRMYSGSVIPMYLVLVGALFIGSLPFMYQGVRNSLESIQTKKLIEAAEILGANRFTSFIRIILPNIRLGLLITTLLIFSSFFGEFVLTNLLIGGRYETIRIYMLRRMNENGHLASSVMVAYFILLILISLVITYLTSPDRRGRKNSNRKQVPGKRADRISLAEPLKSVSILKIGVKKEKRQRI
ncbi:MULTISPECIES: ABC transporter permease subunit [unclassified Mesobacillus]|uniref:ABC transporter permease n=1 Tax=unclassified Mesobacillus TaxID=2675270 RepID=UPI00203D182D|nr:MULTISPECIES: ABC transporter permease subunit [unclassified Mesobacillus]MCM3124468.1 ABC transporter permease subunit [Mesobacillus sp. MER 33]MCM3234822.1 ABC transporter permease subunit [Mesobacillus sp. MER 48]